MKTHADLRDVWNQLCFVPHRVQVDLEIRSWKSQLLRWSPSWSSSSGRKRAHRTFCEEINEQDSHITIHGICERCDVSTGTAEKNCVR